MKEEITIQDAEHTDARKESEEMGRKGRRDALHARRIDLETTEDVLTELYTQEIPKQLAQARTKTERKKIEKQREVIGELLLNAHTHQELESQLIALSKKKGSPFSEEDVYSILDKLEGREIERLSAEIRSVRNAARPQYDLGELMEEGQRAADERRRKIDEDRLAGLNLTTDVRKKLKGSKNERNAFLESLFRDDRMREEYQRKLPQYMWERLEREREEAEQDIRGAERDRYQGSRERKLQKSWRELQLLMMSFDPLVTISNGYAIPDYLLDPAKRLIADHREMRTALWRKDTGVQENKSDAEISGAQAETVLTDSNASAHEDAAAATPVAAEEGISNLAERLAMQDIKLATQAAQKVLRHKKLAAEQAVGKKQLALEREKLIYLLHALPVIEETIRVTENPWDSLAAAAKDKIIDEKTYQELLRAIQAETIRMMTRKMQETTAEE